MTLSLSVADDRLGAYYRRTAAIADRLGKSLDFDQVMVALQRIHDGELGPLILRTGEFPVYLDIEVGGKSKDELLAELKSKGFFVSDWACNIMSKDAWKIGEKEQIKFARATIRDLGFTKNPTTKDVWARIRELGHVLCEPGDGPAIRLALKDQKPGDYFWIVMDQIADSDGDPRVFDVMCSGDGRRWLYTGGAHPDGHWLLGSEVVFRLRK